MKKFIPVLLGVAMTASVMSPALQVMAQENETEITTGSMLAYCSSYSVGAVNEDGGVAEIVKYNADNQCMYVVSGQLQCVDIVKINEDGSTALTKRISVGEMGSAYGFNAGDITSVDVNNTLGIVAIAVQHSDYTQKGSVVVLDYDGSYITHFEAGVQPDMICFTPDGKYILTANEGEPREGYGEGTTDPKGGVTLISLDENDITKSIVKECDFTAFDAQRDTLIADKVLLKKGTAPSVDLEPEYIAVSEDGTKAYVSLQENNAIATLDLASGTFTAVKGLGFKDYSTGDNKLDLNKNGEINIQNEDVLGVYMPDGLATVTIGGVDYVITPNEGDAREWGDYADIDSKKINGSSKKVEYLINEEFDGLEEGKTYILGARSFSIFRADTMEQVYDSKAEFEEITAQLYPEYFNTNHKEVEMEARSNKKGQEPEDVKVMEAEGKIYALIGLERMSGIMMYDITDPANASFVDYFNNRDFTQDDLSLAGDIGAEGICTIDAVNSPSGYPMVLAANEISGTVTVMQLKTGYVDKEEDTDNNTGSASEEEFNIDWEAVKVKLTEGAQASAANNVTNTNVEVLIGTDTAVPQHVLAHMTGKPVTAAFQTGRGICFSVTGMDLTGEAVAKTSALDFLLDDSVSGNGEKALASVTEGAAACKNIFMSSKQTYEVPVNVHVSFEKAYAGKTAALYEYNEQTGTWDECGTYVVTEKGQTMFALTHAGDYAAVVE